MPLKCLIAEDNVLERDLLELLLRQVEGAAIVAVCDSGPAALRYLSEHPVDVLFTDIDMPQVSGISLLKSLPQPPVAVFISAHPEYAATGYELDVADFIVKPVTLPRLFKAFAKARDLVARNRAPQPLPVDPAVVFMRADDGLRKLALDTISYAESKENFSLLHLRDGTRQLILVGLKGLSEQLPEARFLRVHRNYLINWNRVVLVQREAVVLEGGTEIPVGEVYRPAVEARLAGERILKRRQEP